MQSQKVIGLIINIVISYLLNMIKCDSLLLDMVKHNLSSLDVIRYDLTLEDITRCIKSYKIEEYNWLKL